MLRTLTSSFTSRWLTGVLTGLIWTVAVAVVAYWALQFAGVSGPVAQAPTVASATLTEPAQADVQKALGANASSAVVVDADAGGRFVLSGVVAGHSGLGAALIAVDGQAPKAFKVGQAVADGLVLQSLAPRQARLAATLEGPAALTLDMPALANSVSGPNLKP